MPLSRLAICSWSVQPTGPEDLIRACRELAIPAVQLAISPVVREPDVWSGVFRRLREESIRIVSGMMAMTGEDYSSPRSIARTGGVRPDETWAENLSHAEAVAEIAQREGLRLVTTHAGFIPELIEGESEDPERIKLFDRLETIADLFASRGLDLALETGQETAENLAIALREINRPNIGVNFDPANMILYNMGDPIEALRRLATHIVQIHIKDAVPPARAGEWGTEVAMGRGKVDWERFFEIALEIQPPVKLVIEREAGTSRIEDIRRAKKLIIDHLARL